MKLKGQTYQNKSNHILAFCAEEKYLISTPHGNLPVKEGDYIIESTPGEFYVVEKKSFSRLFHRQDNGYVNGKDSHPPKLQYKKSFTKMKLELFFLGTLIAFFIVFAIKVTFVFIGK